MGKIDKSMANRSKVVKIFIALGVIILLYLVIAVVNSSVISGVKSQYCISSKECVTVWKNTDKGTYILFQNYSGLKYPTENFVRIGDVTYASILFVDHGKIMIDINKEQIIENKAKQIEIYQINGDENDTLYTYLDGKYRKYRKNVRYISINLDENYARTINGRIMR